MPQMLFIMFASITQEWLVLSILVILDHRVHKELKVDKDIKELRELKELRDSKEFKERPAPGHYELSSSFEVNKKHNKGF